MSSDAPTPGPPNTDGSLHMPKPITTAMNTVILKFISWVTAADERAVGVDTSLHAGILSCTFIHIYGKTKAHHRAFAHQNIPMTRQKMRRQQNLPGLGDQIHRGPGSPSKIYHIQSSDPRAFTEGPGSPSTRPLLAPQMGRQKQLVHTSYPCVCVYTTPFLVMPPRLTHRNVQATSALPPPYRIIASICSPLTATDSKV